MSKPASKEIIRNWWAQSPMTYGILHGHFIYQDETGLEEPLELGSREFFQRLDQIFYSWNRPLHTDQGVFTRIFPYEKYTGKAVLEIGCGLGTMAMNWAQHGAQLSAVDLNPVAVSQTLHRFELFELEAAIQQEDANGLSFGDASFEYVYSWGVLHHSPDLRRSINELFRVLRPGGGFGVMLYNRQSILYRYLIQYVEGFLHAESRFLNPLQLASRYTDGAREEGNPHTWPVTRREVRKLFAPHSTNFVIKVLGTDLESSLKMLLPGIGQYLPKQVIKAWARRWGWSLWISGNKDDHKSDTLLKFCKTQEL